MRGSDKSRLSSSASCTLLCGKIKRGLLHVPFSGGQATDEAFALEDAIHVVLQRLGLTRQLDAKLGQTPEYGGQAAINQAELVTHEKRHFSKDRGDTHQAFPQLLARF